MKGFFVIYLGNHLYVDWSNQHCHWDIAFFFSFLHNIYRSELYKTKQMSTMPTKTLKHHLWNASVSVFLCKRLISARCCHNFILQGAFTEAKTVSHWYRFQFLIYLILREWYYTVSIAMLCLLALKNMAKQSACKRICNSLQKSMWVQETSERNPKLCNSKWSLKKETTVFQKTSATVFTKRTNGGIVRIGNRI